MQKLVWRVKLEADLGDGSRTEVEVWRIEREVWADHETIGLSLGEGETTLGRDPGRNCPGASVGDGRAFPMLWAMRIEPVKQGIQAGDLSIFVRRRAVACATVPKLFLPRRPSQ
jgi:hypothetical protein